MLKEESIALKPLDDERMVAKFRTAAMGLLTLAGFIVLVAIVGLLSGIEALVKIVPNGAVMVPATAATFLLALIAVLLILTSEHAPRSKRVWIAHSLGILTSMAGAAFLIEYFLGIDLGIDYNVAASGVLYSHPGRPAPETCIAFVFFGLAIFFSARPKPYHRQLTTFFSGMVFAIPAMALTGLYFGDDALYSSLNLGFPTIGIAFNTALAFLFLSLALLANDVHRGITRIFVSPFNAGVLARRLLLAIFLVPPIAGVIFSQLGFERILAEEVTYALAALSTFAVLAAIAWRTTLRLEKSEVENALIQRKLEESVRAREDVLAIVSHDLKNPIGAILGFSSLIRETPETAPSVLQLNESIERAALRSQALIQDLLDHSRIDAGQFSVAPKSCSASSLLFELKDTFAPAAYRKNISLAHSLQEDIDQLFCDKNRLIQALSNLIGNAIKFTPEGGQISLKMEREDKDWVRIIIADNGPGIQASALPHIFDRYWRSRTNSNSGAGLGLFITKGIIESHGGKIHASSQPGRGTQFEILLPSIESHQQTLRSESAEFSEFPQLRTQPKQNQLVFH